MDDLALEKYQMIEGWSRMMLEQTMMVLDNF